MVYEQSTRILSYAHSSPLPALYSGCIHTEYSIKAIKFHILLHYYPFLFPYLQIYILICKVLTHLHRFSFRESMKRLILHLLSLLAFIWQGCIHTYPEEEGMDPTSVAVNIELSFNLNWEQVISYHPATKSDLPPQDNLNTGKEDIHRFIVEISAEGEKQLRHEHYLSQEEFNRGTLTLRVPAILKPTVYQVTAWCDIANGIDSTGHFNVNSLSDIYPVSPRSDLRQVDDCATASAPLDLTSFRNSLSGMLLLPLSMTSPAACFRLMTMDVEEFIRYADPAIQAGETYSLALSYESSRPTAFNASTGLPVNYMDNMELSIPLPTLYSQQAVICSDWLFLGDSKETISICLTLFNSARVPVSRIRHIQIPLQRGKITTVRGDFLTNFQSNVINVDNIWDGEIIITID